MKSILAFLLLLSSCIHTEKNLKPGSPKGMLFIIGGGERDDTLMSQMVDASGWKAGEYITVIPLPSTYDSAYFWINEQLQRLTGQPAMLLDSAAVHNQTKLDTLLHSRIIFIGGGDQSRMMNLIEGTRVKAIIREAYWNGATIGGTSAGAAIMSELMITGNQLLDTVYESTFPRIHHSNIELNEGLGLLDSVIIDMHFIARSRYNRLFSAVLQYPLHQCIGIDEATALILRGDSATVTGESQVVVIETPDHIQRSGNHLISAQDIDVSIFLPGQKFRIKN